MNQWHPSIFERAALVLIGLVVLLAAPAAGVGLLLLAIKQGGALFWVIVILGWIVCFESSKFLSGPLGLACIAKGFQRAPAPNDEERPLVLYLRSFRSDGDSAYPFQAGSARGQHFPEPREGASDAAMRKASVRAATRLIFSHRNPGADNDIGSMIWGLGYEALLASATARVGQFRLVANEDWDLHSSQQNTMPPTRDWRAAIVSALASARLVIIRPDCASGITWEMRQVRQLMKPDRVLLFFPVNMLGQREDDYDAVREVVEQAFGCRLPDKLPDGQCLLGFDSAWTPVIEDYPGILPLAMYLGASTAVAMARSLRARRLPYRHRPPLRAFLNLPVNLLLGALILIAGCGGILKMILRLI